MKAVVFSILVLVAGFCRTAPLNNNNPTIWAEEAVTAMKSQINRIYTFNQGLYNNRHIFDAGSHGCVSPVPASHYWKDNTCPNGNKIASEALIAVAEAWKALAVAMFPVYYHMPDTKGQLRASFSDFSHFYNHFDLEIQSLQNTTSFYVCRANMRPNCDFWSAIATAQYNNADYVVTRFGPIVSYDGTVPTYAGNGTDEAYPYEGPFTDSIRKNSGLEMDGWDDLRIQMSDPGAEFPTNVCKAFVENGLPPPKPPATFP